MFLTLWEFEVKPGSEELFERAYGPEGEWVRLFRRDAGYRGTRLLRDMAAVRLYVTMDMWESRAGYEEFREKYAPEYAKLDAECEGWTVNEKHLGNTGSAGAPAIHMGRQSPIASSESSASRQKKRINC